MVICCSKADAVSINIQTTVLLLSQFSMETAIAFCRDHYLLITGVVVTAIGLKLLRTYFAGGVCRSDARLDGKTVIVTGANTGIGLETARDMARRGARVIMACRDEARGKNAAKAVRKSTGNGNVEFGKLDLSSLQSVRKFAAEILKTETEVNILINNAGIMMCPQRESKDGYELQFATNHLGHFLLTNLLLQKIKASAPSRIVNLSSMAHQFVKTINFDDIEYRKNYHPRLVYAQSKMANILFTEELAKRIKGSGVTVYAVHPGGVNTELSRNMADAGYPMWLINLFSPVLPFFFKSPVEGAQTSIFCAVSEDVKDVTGEYFSDCAMNAAVLPADKETVERRLWEVSEDMVGQKFL